MCIPLGAGYQNILVPPSDRARRLADYLRIAIYLHFTLALFMFLGGRYFDGAFDLIAAAIGYLSIRQHEGYSVQQLLCYCIFCGMDFFWAVIRVIMYVSNVTSDTPTQAWQKYIFLGTLVAAPLIYIVATYLSYQVYKELRQAMHDTINQMEQGGAGPYGGGMAGAAPPGGSSSSGARWNHPEIHPGGGTTVNNTATTTGGFKPFTGTGHRLGAT